MFWSEICHAKAAPQQLPPNLHVKWSAGKKICSRSFPWLLFQFALNHDKLWEIIRNHVLYSPSCSHIIPWTVSHKYPMKYRELSTSSSARLHCRGSGKTHASIIKGFNWRAQTRLAKKNVGDLQKIIGVEPMTNWGKIQQLLSNQRIILRENLPENFFGGFWGRCSLERHFMGTKWDPVFFTGKHSLIRSFYCGTVLSLSGDLKPSQEYENQIIRGIFEKICTPLSNSHFIALFFFCRLISPLCCFPETLSTLILDTPRGFPQFKWRKVWDSDLSTLSGRQRAWLDWRWRCSNFPTSETRFPDEKNLFHLLLEVLWRIGKPWSP